MTRLLDAVICGWCSGLALRNFLLCWPVNRQPAPPPQIPGQPTTFVVYPASATGYLPSITCAVMSRDDETDAGTGAATDAIPPNERV